VPPDRFDYNEALARSSKEQLLINLVRLRYDDVPVFLAVVPGSAGSGATVSGA
jgi:hypothetical protein